mmetsp:Transcript_16712/g.33400  ORF Transcript_16712/g.33400 Transcript_16712/m.33400 type:complete len:154 (+) Transcript_16712:60-521(+)
MERFLLAATAVEESDPARCPWHQRNCPLEVPRYKPEAAEAAAMAMHGRLGRDSKFGEMLGGVEDVVKDIIFSGTGGGDAEVLAWSKQCQARCQQLQGGKVHGGMGLRTHLQCPRCAFKFIYRTGNYSLRATSDVVNHGACPNPLCQHEWTQRS